ncbi:MAG: hypothetical protein QF911_03505 [Candidatus Thalassarchaeaceae archaeon]|nr:hypothetical protein [Candidatus Thalassarchaeaceae archaeon]
MPRNTIAISFVLLIVIPSLAPPVFGEWESDSWLENVIGPERISLGDEFGCQGYEGVDINSDPWSIAACMDYLSEKSPSSRWGERPISFGLGGKETLPSTESAIIDAGFEIVGDGSVVGNGLQFFPINGGTLEKNVANVSRLESAQQDAIVSIGWIARIHDLRVREDKDAISWLEQQEVWFTTWGEWHHHKIAGSRIAVATNGSTISVTMQESESWTVPGTVKLHFDGVIREISSQNRDELPLLQSSDRHLEVGWREFDGGMFLTMGPGDMVTIELESQPESVLSTPWITFNGLHHAVTVVGQHTTNLFQWSSDFQGSELRFTWLIERGFSEDPDWTLPLLALGIMIAVPVFVRLIVKRDQMTHD